MELSITATHPGRLSSFLLKELKMSTGLMNRLKWGDGIRVNGTPQHTNYPVQPGDVITVTLEEETPEYPAEDGPLTILYEDDWLLAVDKPAGMLIHPSRAKNSGTLANFVAGYYGKTGQKSAFHPLTRLDRDTFGIVLLAKNSHVHALLQQEKPKKTYHALVYGGPAEETGTVTAAISRCPLPSLLRKIDPNGKPCLTEYRVLERSNSTSKLELHPVTGRTHQLRLHCAYLGCPILGDPQYGTEESTAYSARLGIQTQLLCAKRLEFTHPLTGERITLDSKMTIL
ncbi:MAG: RluA family pseudouridine synthase [Candidatus Faecousia sp.]|nr:RluA family pseudouridine synthase [Candidatus Faecousia sp.]